MFCDTLVHPLCAYASRVFYIVVLSMWVLCCLSITCICGCIVIAGMHLVCCWFIFGCMYTGVVAGRLVLRLSRASLCLFSLVCFVVCVSSYYSFLFSIYDLLGFLFFLDSFLVSSCFLSMFFIILCHIFVFLFYLL